MNSNQYKAVSTEETMNGVKLFKLYYKFNDEWLYAGEYTMAEIQNRGFKIEDNYGSRHFELNVVPLSWERETVYEEIKTMGQQLVDEGIF